MGRQKQRHEAHVRLYRHELECPAYRSLSPEARALLVEFRALYNGDGNRVYMSVREMRRRLNGIHQRRVERARDELLDRGFIELLTPGSFSLKRRHATEYALTHEPTEGDLKPKKTYMRWRPQKNTVTTVDTLGNHSGYRGREQNGKNQPDGNHSGYREGQNSASHGNHSGYTDKLPRAGAIKDAPDWLMEHGGWPCGKGPMQGEVLNTCCIVCGVWTTAQGQEFDGARHSCNKVDKAEYRARLEADGMEIAA